MKARIRNAIRPYEDLLTSVKRRKLKWHGNFPRSSGLAKFILEGTVQGGRRRGRQRKRWEDKIKDWTGLEWNILLRKAENREEWRKLVVKSAVVHQRSSRLRDRWRWVKWRNLQVHFTVPPSRHTRPTLLKTVLTTAVNHHDCLTFMNCVPRAHTPPCWPSG